MFFILSKTIGLLTKPLAWLIIFMLMAVLGRKPKLKRISLIAALTVLLIFTNPLLLNTTLKLWEPEPVAIESLHTYDIGIVLGGFSKNLPEYKNIELTEAGDRLWQTVSLYKQKKIKKILISGGSTWKKNKAEAQSVRNVLLTWGIPADDILAEAESRNTHENAKNSAEMIALVHPGANCLLITSALHMKRSLACFRKVGVNPDSFPAEHIARHNDTFWAKWLIPGPEVIKNWDRIINEWIGIFAYKIQGYM